MAHLRSWIGLVLAAATASCLDDASVDVKFAQGFTPARATVSVLGVFRDGRMSTEAWGPIGPSLSASLGGQSTCEAAYGDRLQQENQELYASIDADVRANGITDDLLTKLAPRAEGELILTISIHGSTPAATVETEQPAQGSAMPGPMRGGGTAGRARAGQRQGPLRTRVGPKGLELSASLFSVRLHQSVARVRVIYTGASVEEAVQRFVAALGTAVPGSTCRGWSWGEHQ
jgi:hypothetical protein